MAKTPTYCRASLLGLAYPLSETNMIWSSPYSGDSFTLRLLKDSIRMEKLKSQIKMNQAYARALRKELNDLKKKYAVNKCP